jgi:AcrR family transcriptional regulator
LLLGIAAAVAEKSYAEATIADIARHSHVSKRTFYEHFPDKEACFLAAYNDLSTMLLQRITEAVAQTGNDDRGIDASTRAYFAGLEENAPIIAAFFTDVQAAGPAALKLRREIHQRYADQIRSVADAGVAAGRHARSITPQMSLALVGALTELVLMGIENGRADKLSEYADTAIELFRAVFSWDPKPTQITQR